MNPRKIKRSDKEWRNILTKEQYHILREKGTEAAFTGIFWNHFQDGTYICSGCGQELFSSETKYNSSCGWPSFTNPIKSDQIEEQRDSSYGMERIEVLCKSCGGHLGHVFNDGPKDKGGLRYCINSVSLKFQENRK